MNLKDRDVLRTLAGRWMELANLPVMRDRKRLWTALKDLRSERPMLLFEIWTLENYVAESELECEDPAQRGVERQMRWSLRHAEEVGDDVVLEPCWRVGWHVEGTGYGVPIVSRRAMDIEGGHIGYAFNHPIRTPADIERLQPRTWTVNREASHEWVSRLQDIFGDILPVILHGTRGVHVGLTGDLFRLIGNENLMTWTFDEPEALHRLMAYLRDDRISYYRWMEAEGLLGLNHDSALVGSGSPGFTTALPQPDYAGTARLRDLWTWMESQETTCISPAMSDEFFHPYMGEVARMFGLVYYGCCEPVHDRWESIRREMPHVRAVSISPWCDMNAMAEKLGKKVVFSRKPKPWPMSGHTPDWDTLEKDLHETLSAARDCHLEFLYRDVYRIHGDRSRLRRWADMVRAEVGGQSL